MATIMWFSTGDFSAENTGSVLKPLLRWLLPGITTPQIDAVHALVRKSAHVTEYAVLAALWFVALPRERRLSTRRAAGPGVRVAVGSAGLCQVHEATAPSRPCSGGGGGGRGRGGGRGAAGGRGRGRRGGGRGGRRGGGGAGGVWGGPLRGPPCQSVQTFRRGSSVSRRPSPKRLMPSTVTRMASPGNVASHHAVEM